MNLRKYPKKDQLIFSSTWHQEFQCEGRGPVLARSGCEDGLVNEASVSWKSSVALATARKHTLFSPNIFKTNFEIIFKVT